MHTSEGARLQGRDSERVCGALTRMKIGVWREFWFGCTLAASMMAGSSCQSLPNLIDAIPSSVPITTNTPTFISPGAAGESHIYGSFGLPAPFEEVLINAIFNGGSITQDMRIYSRYGIPLLSYSSGGAGLELAFIKTFAGTNFAVSSVKWSAVQLNYLRIQQFTILGGVFATSGTPITNTDTRVPRILNDPDTLYFYGVTLDRIVKYLVTDGSAVYTSAGLVSPNQYSEFAFLVIELDMLLVWFQSQNTLCAMGRIGSAIFASKTNMGDVIGDRSIQSRTDSKMVWNNKIVAGNNQIVLQRRVITDDFNLLTTVVTSASTLPFVHCDLAQLATQDLILVFPQHTSADTPQSVRGSIYFVTGQQLIIFEYVTPQTWTGFVAARAVMNPVDEHGGSRFYVAFGDAVSNNLHTYYLLVDVCMNPSDFTLACTVCPDGYWRSSAALPTPRRCLSPAQFPPQTGMNNLTITFEPCAVTGCTICTFDHTRCLACDTASGFYLHTTSTADECLEVPQFPDGFGLDAIMAKVAACQDRYCADCRADFGRCSRCDTTRQAYLLDTRCVHKSALLSGQGPNLLLGTVQLCVSSGCADCTDDLQKCIACFVHQHRYLDPATNSCMLFSDFAVDQGPDPDRGTVVRCQDTACVDCKMHFRQCDVCNSSRHFAFEGHCRQFGGARAPVISRLRYLIQDLAVQVRFARPVRLVYTADFFDSFAVRVEDALTGTNYTCSARLTGERMACSLVVQESDLWVVVRTAAIITRGVFYLQPMSDSPTAGPRAILDAASSQAFDEFPIIADDFTTDSPFLVRMTAGLVETASQSQGYLSWMVAALSPRASVIFDQYLVTLEYLSLLEGPLLVYPQQIFDTVGGIANYLPVQWLPGPERFEVFAQMSECRPSRAFERQGYECSLAGNVGPDTFAFLIFGISCVLITVVCNKIIDMRIKASSSVLNPVPAQAEFKKHAFAKSLAEIMHKSNSSSKAVFARKQITDSKTGSALRNQTSEVQSSIRSFLPSGKIDSSKVANPNHVVKFCVSLREAYGLSFCFVKLEATQIKLMLPMFLNYWNYNQGNLEQYSLIAAIIFTLYYIFQGYFTYQFAASIWREVETMKLLKHSAVESTAPDSDSPPSTRVSETSTAAKHTTSLHTLLPDLFDGPNRDIRSLLYQEMAVPERWWQLFGPVVSEARALVLALVTVMLSRAPTVQVIFAIIVEIAYLVFIIKGPKLNSRCFNLLAALGQISLVAFLGIKLLTIGDTASEADLQTGFGWWMVLILTIYVFIGITAGLYEIGRLLYTKLKSCRKRKSNDTAPNQSSEIRSKIDPSQTDSTSRNLVRQVSVPKMKTITLSDELSAKSAPNVVPSNDMNAHPSRSRLDSPGRAKFLRNLDILRPE